ncbi:MAG: preprotein translocase subunit SecG, partial [Verrucomicrobiota bacterium]
MAILSILLTVIIITVSILGVLIVLAQRPKQEGLGAAFGGSTLDSALGAHTTDILQKITTWLLIIFFVSAIGLAMIKTRQYDQSAASNVLESVEEREMDLPDFAPALQNPDLDSPVTPAPAEDSSTSLLDDVLAPADDAPAPAENAPAPAEDAPGAGEAPAGGEKEKAKVEKAAPEEKSEAPKEKAKAPAEG